MNYKILVIDDDEPMHVITKSILRKEFDTEHARNAQQAIDLLSVKKFNLILSDIHMPGLSGLEFLESLMKDAGKKQIPVLIMTNLPTVEKERKALNLGAEDFIDKVLFTHSKEEILKRVRMKLVTNLDIPDLNQDLITQKNKLISDIMSAAVKSDFKATVDTLCRGLEDQFKTDYISFWSIKDEDISMLSQNGNVMPGDYNNQDLKDEHAFQILVSKKKPYLTNHISNDELGVMTAFSEENNLPAEIAVPLFAINERALLMNNMEVPHNASLFGLIIMKRNKLYSTKEFEMVSRLLIQTGSILWRLSEKIPH